MPPCTCMLRLAHRSAAGPASVAATAAVYESWSPEAVPSSATVIAPSSATAPVSDPSARPGRNRALVASSPVAASTALAITVGTNGPGAMAPAQLLHHDHQLLETVIRAA